MACAAVAFASCTATALRIGDGWGTNIHWTNAAPGEAALLSKAFKLARMDFAWQSIEKAGACGVYDFSAYRSLLATMKAEGVRPYWILGYSNSCYAADGVCNTTQCIAAYGNFAAATVAAFAGNGIIFETENEPNGNGYSPAVITALCLAAGPHFKAAGETWVGPATSGIDFKYLNATFAAGILDVFTAVSVHPYRAAPPDGVLADYTQLNGLIASYSSGPAPPVYSGEWGYTTAGPGCGYGNRQTRQYQAAFAVRMLLINELAGVNISILYDWRNDGTDPQSCEGNFGTVGKATGDPAAPFELKPAYSAMLVLQTILGNSSGLHERVTPKRVVAAHKLDLGGVVATQQQQQQRSEMYAAEAGAAAAAVPQPENVFVLSFQAPPPPGQQAGAAYAVWTNGSYFPDHSCPTTPPPNLIDCGFYGIGKDECTGTRGCCWLDPDPNGLPQCYRGVQTTCTIAGPDRTLCVGAPSGANETVCAAAGCCYDEWGAAGAQTCYNGAPPLSVTFPSSYAQMGACYSVTDMMGRASGQACVNGQGLLTVNATDRPVYLTFAGF